jgi:hypothetical protein
MFFVPIWLFLVGALAVMIYKMVRWAGRRVAASKFLILTLVTMATGAGLFYVTMNLLYCPEAYMLRWGWALYSRDAEALNSSPLNLSAYHPFLLPAGQHPGFTEEELVEEQYYLECRHMTSVLDKYLNIYPPSVFRKKKWQREEENRDPILVSIRKMREKAEAKDDHGFSTMHRPSTRVFSRATKILGDDSSMMVDTTTGQPVPPNFDIDKALRKDTKEGKDTLGRYRVANNPDGKSIHVRLAALGETVVKKYFADSNNPTISHPFFFLTHVVKNIRIGPQGTYAEGNYRHYMEGKDPGHIYFVDIGLEDTGCPESTYLQWGWAAPDVRSLMTLFKVVGNRLVVRSVEERKAMAAKLFRHDIARTASWKWWPKEWDHCYCKESSHFALRHAYKFTLDMGNPVYFGQVRIQ